MKMAAAVVEPRITSGFVFKSVFGDSPERCKALLERALGLEIAEVEIAHAEHELDVLAGARAGRLDVYVVDADGNRYDVEVQAESRGDEVLRARHYQALMDASRLRRGAEVRELCRCVVVFLCDFDPIGDGRRVYECATWCRQTGREVDDGRLAVFLNARGTEGEVSVGLDAFLRYARGEGVDGDPFVDDIRGEIERLVQDPKWLEDFMTFEDELEAARRNAEERGRHDALLSAARSAMASLGLDAEATLDAIGVGPGEMRTTLLAELAG